MAVDYDRGEALVLARIEQYRGTCRYFEYYVLDANQHVLRSHSPEKLPKKWARKLAKVASSDTRKLQRWNRTRRCWEDAKSAPKGFKRSVTTRWITLNPISETS